jgi:hypothetical protein
VIRPVLKERSYDFRLTGAGGFVQGRATAETVRMGIGTRVEKQSDGSAVASGHGLVERQMALIGAE